MSADPEIELVRSWTHCTRELLDARVTGPRESSPSSLYDSRHADELGQMWPTEGWNVFEAANWVSLIRAALDTSVHDLDWGLAIRGASDRRLTRRPPLAKFKPRLVEPPSIYLFHKLYNHGWFSQHEEYRCGFPQDELPPDLRDLRWQFISRREVADDARSTSQWANVLWAYPARDGSLR